MAEEEAGSVNDTLGIPKISALCGFGDGALLISFLVFFSSLLEVLHLLLISF